MKQIEKLFSEIELELSKAISKFPTWPTDPNHASAIVAEESGELTRSVLEHTYEPHKSSLEDVRTEAKQTAAMAIRFLMSIDKYNFKPSEQHDQGE